MGVIGNKGIDVRQTSNRIINRVFLQDVNGNSLPSGTTTLMFGEIQDDATIKTYDFNDNTFKSEVCTTPTVSITHRPLNNGTIDSGLWTYLHTNLAGFTKNAIYLTIVTNNFASPKSQVREWQFGGEQGDADTLGSDNKVLISANNQDLSASLDVNAKKLGGASPNNLAAGAAMTLTAAYDAAKNAASQNSVNSIPTGTLLSGDVRLNNLDALISSRSTLTASQVWAALTSGLTTPGSIGAWILDKLDVKVSSVSAGSVPTVAQIWNYAWRTLTTNHGQVVVNENTVQVNTYNTLSLPIENLGSFVNYVAIYVTVKQSKKDADSQAILQARKRADGVGDGLLVALGQLATAGDGSITISDASLGNLVFMVKDTIMSQIQTGDYVADVKIIRSTGVLSEVLRNIKFVVSDTVTKAIS